MVGSDNLSQKPQVESNCASWMMGLKISKLGTIPSVLAGIVDYLLSVSCKPIVEVLN